LISKVIINKRKQHRNFIKANNIICKSL